MQFEALFLSGAWRIHAAPVADARGSFTRLFDADRFAVQGLETHFTQQAVSQNPARGTLRGLHFQQAPQGEVKVIRCSRGAIHDVIVDIRPESPTYLQHCVTLLSEDVPTLLYVPQGFAHGFLTLREESAVEYQMSAPYVAEAQRGIRWNDPRLGIKWPEAVQVISERDANFADWTL